MSDEAYAAWLTLQEVIEGFQETFGGALYGPETIDAGNEEGDEAQRRPEPPNEQLLSAVLALQDQCQNDLRQAETITQYDQANKQLIAAAGVSLMLASDQYALTSIDLGVIDPARPGLSPDFFWEYRRLTARDLMDRTERLFDPGKDDEGGGSPAPLMPASPPGDGDLSPPPTPVKKDIARERQEFLKANAPRLVPDGKGGFTRLPRIGGGQHLDHARNAERREALACANAMMDTCGKSAVNLARGAIGDGLNLDTIGSLNRVGPDIDGFLDASVGPSESDQAALPFLKTALHQLSDIVVDSWLDAFTQWKPVRALRKVFLRALRLVTRALRPVVGFRGFESDLDRALFQLRPDWDEREQCRKELNQLEYGYEHLGAWAGYLQPWIATIAAAGSPVASAGVSVGGFVVLAALLRDRLDTMPNKLPGVAGIPSIIRESDRR